MFLQPFESEGGPYFFRLQCPGWEVAEWPQWQLTRQTRPQSGIIPFVITGEGLRFTKHAAQNCKDEIRLSLAKKHSHMYMYFNGKIYAYLIYNSLAHLLPPSPSLTSSLPTLPPRYPHHPQSLVPSHQARRLLTRSSSSPAFPRRPTR